MIDTLQRKNGAGVTEIANELGHSKSTVHSHLRTHELFSAGTDAGQPRQRDGQ
nr:helix-turn-helix domain-containing protein [Halopiger aswanensis]